MSSALRKALIFTAKSAIINAWGYAKMTTYELLNLKPKTLKDIKKKGVLVWNADEAKSADDKTLTDVFCKVMGEGYDGFSSDTQREAIKAVMRGEDVIAIMPTGGGKSACFQFPAAVRYGTVVVVSPLISLLREQAQKAQVPAVYVSRRNINSLSKDNANVRLILVSPETLNSPKFVRFARDVLENISMLVVDEAHCVALWGNTFRQDYLNIGRFFDRTGKRPQVIALSATLTPSMIDTVKSVLRMKDENLFETYGNLTENKKKALFMRGNIDLSVIETKPDFDKNPIPSEKYIHLKKDLLPSKNAVIIFCSHVDTVNLLHSKLNDDPFINKNYEVLKYHGQMDSEQRIKNQNAFCGFDFGKKKNEKAPKNKVMVATNAFGMGIDKQGIPLIIFFEIPHDVENYAQEFGRAGRGGNPAQAILYFSENDIKRVKAEQSTEEDDFERTLLQLRFSVLEENIVNSKSRSIKDFIADYFVNESRYVARYFKYNETELSLEEFQNQLAENNKKLSEPYRFPDELYINVCPPAYSIERGEYTEGTPIINTAYKNLRDEITLRSRVDYLDLMTANAVYTYGFNGKKRITAEDVLRLLLGDENAKCDKREIDEIRKRINRLRKTEITLWRPVGLFRDTNGDLFSNINGVFLELDVDKSDKNVFIYKTTPPLFKYAEVCNGELFAIDRSWLKIVGRGKLKKQRILDNSLESVKLTTFIAWRVHLLGQYRSTWQTALREYRETGKINPSETEKKTYSTIRFENSDSRRKSMYDILQSDVSDNEKKQEIVNKVRVILDYYKNREIIAGYKEITAYNRTVGVQLGETAEPIKKLPKAFYFCESETAKKLITGDYKLKTRNEYFTLTAERKPDYFDLMITGVYYALGNFKGFDADIAPRLVWTMLTGDAEAEPSDDISDEIRNRINMLKNETMIKLKGERKKSPFLRDNVVKEDVNGERKQMTIPESKIYDSADKKTELLKIKSSLMYIKSAKQGGKRIPDTIDHVIIKHFVTWQVLRALAHKEERVVLTLNETSDGTEISSEMSENFTPKVFVHCTKKHVREKALAPIIMHLKREGIGRKVLLEVRC